MGDGACTRGGCCCWGGNGWPIPPTLPHPASQSPPCAMPHRPVRANSVRHLWVVVRISLAMSCKGYKKSSPASGPRHGSTKHPGAPGFNCILPVWGNCVLPTMCNWRAGHIRLRTIGRLYVVQRDASVLCGAVKWGEGMTGARVPAPHWVASHRAEMPARLTGR